RSARTVTARERAGYLHSNGGWCIAPAGTAEGGWKTPACCRVRARLAAALIGRAGPQENDMATRPVDELQRISANTLEHYRQHAEGFRAGTLDHDVSQNLDALLRHMQAAAP